jgi:hypothetical protein
MRIIGISGTWAVNGFSDIKELMTRMYYRSTEVWVKGLVLSAFWSTELFDEGEKWEKSLKYGKPTIEMLEYHATTIRPFIEKIQQRWDVNSHFLDENPILQLLKRKYTEVPIKHPGDGDEVVKRHDSQIDNEFRQSIEKNKKEWLKKHGPDKPFPIKKQDRSSYQQRILQLFPGSSSFNKRMTVANDQPLVNKSLPKGARRIRPGKKSIFTPNITKS